MKIDHAIVYFYHPNNVGLAISGLHSNFAGQKVMCRLAGQKSNMLLYSGTMGINIIGRIGLKKGVCEMYLLNIKKRPKPFLKGETVVKQLSWLSSFLKRQELFLLSPPAHRSR